ncbi:MAG: DUF2975 domain-containing protein [Micropruina sp.]|uniref:DUF2975 domain-containing protein n=1 Tax=Micropruina sp. TaxID=2737536 RepID=UPI0039E39F1D
MTRGVIAWLRVLLASIMLGTLAAQFWFFPTLAGQLAQTYPELDWLRWPLLAVVIVVILGVQVGLVALWVLLSMVESDSVFSPAAFGWVNLIIAVAVVDTVMVLGAYLVLSFGVGANPPGLALLQLALVVCGAAFALLMAVMKGLLRKASRLDAELSEVI